MQTSNVINRICTNLWNCVCIKCFFYMYKRQMQHDGSVSLQMANLTIRVQYEIAGTLQQVVNLPSKSVEKRTSPCPHGKAPPPITPVFEHTYDDNTTTSCRTHNFYILRAPTNDAWRWRTLIHTPEYSVHNVPMASPWGQRLVLLSTVFRLLFHKWIQKRYSVGGRYK